MDIVLGVSRTATTVRMVLVEGERADGVTIESEAFDTFAASGVPRPGPSEQVSNAILATQRNALSTGHHLVASGVTWEDEEQHAQLRDGMVARNLDNVVLMPEQSAAGALAQTIGCALGYDSTAVLLINFDTATLSIVDSADGSIAEVLTRNVGGARVSDVLPDIVTSLEKNAPRPQGIVIVGSCVDIGAVKSNLESLIALPVIVPEEPDLGLARGAALVAANAAGLDAPTVGLAYSQDPDGDGVKLSDANTEVSPPVELGVEDDLDSVVTQSGRALLIPVGSFVGTMCVLGAATLVMSLAVSIRSTGDHQNFPAAPNAVVPSAVVQTPFPTQSPSVAQNPPSVPQGQLMQPQPLPPGPEPVASVPPPPVAAPVQKPTLNPLAAAPVLEKPAPSRVISEPTPVAVEKPLDDAPVAAGVPPPAAPPLPAPVAAPPPLALPPSIAAASVPPARQAPTFPWGRPTLRIGPFQIPLGPQQPTAAPPEQVSPQQPISPWAPRQAQPPAWLPPQAAPPVPDSPPLPQTPRWWNAPESPPVAQSPPQPPSWVPPQDQPPVLRGRDGGHEHWWPWG
ncbi:MAG: hypothetical protein JO044_04280 [Mycobacteriaceae bacterium]|nr:hypothetical protein [Mycobacteriaceae bacterium]MBV9641172.1 hypothetical protein [Mycobacteriaceae bacterium]